MNRSVHDTMKILEVGQTWVNESGASRKILELKFTGAHCGVRYHNGVREYVCHSDIFAAWVTRSNAKTL